MGMAEVERLNEQRNFKWNSQEMQQQFTLIKESEVDYNVEAGFLF